MLHHLDTTKKRIIGKSVKSIERVGDSDFLITFTDEPQLKLGVYGDCCSHSIFYDLEHPDNPGVILDVKEYEEGDSQETAVAKIREEGFDIDTSDDYNELKIWNVVFVTTNGNIVFKHVNSSNGCYDGQTSYEWFYKPKIELPVQFKEFTGQNKDFLRNLYRQNKKVWDEGGAINLSLYLGELGILGKEMNIQFSVRDRK